MVPDGRPTSAQQAECQLFLRTVWQLGFSLHNKWVLKTSFTNLLSAPPISQASPVALNSHSASNLSFDCATFFS